MLDRNLFFSFFVAIIFALLSFEAQILFSFLTTARISLLLLILLLAILISKGAKLSVSKDFTLPILFFIFVILWAIINLFFHLLLGHAIDIKPLISILLITLSIIMLSLVFEKNELKYELIIKFIWLIGTITIYITTLILWLKAEFNIFDGAVRLSVIKNHFNDTLVSGTSRFFYGLITLNIFSVGFGFNYIRSTKNVRIISLINLGVIITLLILANSRQNLLFLLFVIVVSKLLSYKITRIFTAIFRISILSVLIFFILSLTTGIIPLIKEKYIERTTKQLEEGSKRTETYKSAIEDIVSNPVFGVGLGNFEKTHNITTHNGYLWIGSELGIFPLLIYLLFIFWIISTFRKTKYLRNKHKHISKVMFAYILGYIIISNNFNELFKDYIFYAMLILYMSILNLTNEQKPLLI